MAKASGRRPARPTSRLESPAGNTDGRGHADAMAIYERALRSLQQRNYAEAADLLRRVVAGFPDEREVLERSRLYLALCDRYLEPPTAEPGNSAERLYAATLALNAGAPDRAMGYLMRIAKDDPANDQALYLLAVAHAEQGDTGVAIRYLEQAIEANPENRALARVDPDLEALRRDAGWAPLLGRPRLEGSGKRAARR
jgi:tetratricopeptide (TPR) repeat protein